MIVELFGCPGAGKTYIINAIKGDSSIAMTSKNKFTSVMIGLAKRLVVFSPNMLILKRRVKNVIRGKRLEARYINKSINYLLDKIIIVAFGYGRLENKKHIFMDEGIIHRVVSFAVNYNLEIEDVLNILKILEPYFKKSMVFYLDVSETKCFEGIRKRNRKECEMDFFDDVKLKAFIKEYKKYFDSICYYYHFEKITRESYSKLEEKIK